MKHIYHICILNLITGIIVLSFIFISIQCSNSLRINLSNDDKRHAIRAVSNSINQFSSEFYEVRH